MIIWDYKEAIKEIKNGKNNDKKSLNAIIKNMAESGIPKTKIEKEIFSILGENVSKEPIKKQIANEYKKIKKENKCLREIVKFSAEELQKIKEIDEKDAQKVLFCMEVYCKSRGVNYIYFCSRSEVKIKDIMDASKVPFSVKRFCAIMRKLYLSGAIKVEPNMRVTIKDISVESIEGNEVKVSKNSVDWLEVYMGRGIFCQKCGAFVKKKGNNKKYCQKCAEEVKKERDKIRKLKI